MDLVNSMGPKQAWGTFSLLVLLADIAAVIALANVGCPLMVVASLGMMALLIFAYVAYKRYHVEVVSESDIDLFTDIDDLRLLSRIYGLGDSGDEQALRERLMDFARSNRSNAFAWVAPKAVLSLGSALELAERPTAEPAPTKPLLTGGQERSEARLTTIRSCPICEARVSGKDIVCRECGADLEFYTVFRESKVGRRFVSAKAREVRRKLRYDVPSLGGKT